MYQNIKEVIEEKNLGINVYGIIADKNQIHKIEDTLQQQLLLIQKSSSLVNKRIELNYTGGTKVLSVGEYSAFKKYALNNGNDTYILSYIDGEKEKILYEVIEEGIKEETFYQKLNQLKSIIDLSIIDIGKIHHLTLKDETQIYDWKLGEKIFQSFVDLDKNQYQQRIEFFDALLGLLFTIKNHAIKKKKLEEATISKYKELENKITNLLQSNLNPYTDVLRLDDFAIKGKRLSYQLIESLTGFWFEDYIHKLLIDLWDEDHIITDVLRSVKPNVKKDKKKFEVDLVVLKKHKIFSISVTMIEDDAINKLFEVKEKAKQIGGVESGICFISLCRDSEILEDRFKNIWDQESPKNTLIIGQDRFKDIKRLLKEWIGE